MKYSVAAALTLLCGSLASPAQHHLHRREAEPAAVTVYNTAVVVVDSNGNVVNSPSGATATVAVQGEEAQSADPSSAPTSTSEAAVAPSNSAESSSSSSSSAPAATSASGSTPGGSAGSAGALGITYTPYAADGSCKTSSEVAADLAELSGYSVIRLYGVDCNQVANVYAAKASSQKLFLGVYYMDAIQSSIETMNSGINGDWSCVHTVNIGNELVNSGQATPSQVGSYVSQGRSQLKSLGYTGPVVSVDTFIATINNPELCQYSDYMAVNAHAFFDGGVSASGAGTWAVEQTQRVWTACGGSKSVLITESGWPWSGDSNGAAVPSVPNQQAAIDSLKSQVGNDVFLFTAYNDQWKSPGYLNVEQCWGLYGNAHA